MADKLQWMAKLSKHPIFKELLRSNKNETETSESKNILAERDGEIFVWLSSKSRVLTTNLKNLQFENERATKFQALLCTSAPFFSVDTLQFSITGKYLALVGDRGITVLEVPQRWGRFAEYEGGSDTIICKTIVIDERFFSTHHKVHVLQANWHPGSPVDGHLVVLTSDNKLRIYNILKPDYPEQIINLGDPFSSEEDYTRSSMSSASAYAIAFGETSVAFDFAPPIRVPGPRSLLASRNNTEELIYPMFVLRENADIYYLTFQLGGKGPPLEMAGPLTMHPAADDNYGLDACSILCLHSTPPVVAMATANGRVYHCIVLESSEDDESGEEEDGSVWEDKQQSSSSDLTLYVHECIELQRSLMSRHDDAVSSASNDDCENTCPVKLYKDTSSLIQYHCSHPSGVHTVTLEWLHKLQRLYTAGASSGTGFDTDDEAAVNYMVCTTPTSDSPPTPVHGLCVISDPLLGSALLCITSSMECTTRQLDSLHISPSSQTTEDEKDDTSEGTSLSPMKHLYTGSFFNHIKHILARNSSAPVLRADKSNKPLSQQDFLEILTEAQQNLREEYIQKQNQAREEIGKRVSILKDQREKQQQDLHSLRENGSTLRQHAEALGEKLYDISTKEENLQYRIDAVRQHIQTHIPVLSDAEKNMKEELETMKIQLGLLQDSLNQIKAKRDYQAKRRHSSRSDQSHRSPALNSSQQRNIKSILENESIEISDLVNQVKGLKLQVGL